MFNIISPKLVSNALLSTLNTRRSHHQELLGQEGQSSQANSSRGSTTLVSSFRRKTKEWSGGWLNSSRNGHNEKAEYGGSFPLPSILPHSPRHTDAPVDGDHTNALAGAIHVTTVQEQFGQLAPDHKSTRQGSFQSRGEMKSDIEHTTSQQGADEEETSIRLTPVRPTPSRDAFGRSESSGEVA